MPEDFQTRNGFYHRASDRYYTILERNGEWFQRRHQKGFDGAEINVVEKRIDYVIGSGNHARSYASRSADGKLIELPVSWYTENRGYWAMSPGFDRANHQDFRRVILPDCIGCHNAYPRTDDGGLPEGIDCQRCHGPGEAHVRAAGAVRADLAKVRASIVNPKHLSRERQVEVCMQCHLETTSSPLPHMIQRFDRAPFSYHPGEPLGDYALYFDHAERPGGEDKFEIAHAAYRLRKSACFQGGEMTCTTCHDPHSVARDSVATEQYISACRKCHPAAHATDPVTLNRTNCLDCHMPKRRTDDAIHVIMTDHLIQRRSPGRDLLAPRVEPDAQKPYRGEVIAYYPPGKPARPGDELYLALAQVQQGSNLEAGIPRLRLAIENYRPQRPEFALELGRAYARAGRTEEAIRWFEGALAISPSYQPAGAELGAALLAAGRPGDAVEVLERRAGSDASVLTNLTQACLRQGDIGRAHNAVTKALSLNSENPDAHHLLGLVLLQQGDRTGAESHFREAIRFQPDLAEAQHNLGKLLAERRDFREAEYHLGKAVSAQPAFAEARHTYGLVLLVLQKNHLALEEFQAAVRLAPGMAQAHNDLADLLLAGGRPAEAIAEYRRAVGTNPELHEAQLSLGLALARFGAPADARTQLEAAARSPVAEIRKFAIAALGRIPEGRRP